ncbi:MAG: hypothetical protein E6G41_14255 [Actinobacteria bacterium]|nr:MAG: hypothetical protein E6G41_14255 [Actinomycetota bacterium]
MKLRLLIALAALFVPAVAAASAADTTVDADPLADQVTALGGKVVWVTGKAGHQTLAGAATGPEAKAYRTIDLGRNASGKLVLTYLRCRTFSHCTAFRDDLAGHRKAFKGLAPHGCALSTAPAVWGKHVAYGVGCRKRGRSGLYVDGRRLPLPKAARKYGVDEITSVDLRGGRVAAVAEDIYGYAFSETLAGKQMRSFFVSASEGDSDEHTRGLALSAGGSLWSLVDAEHAGDPNQAIIFKGVNSCLESESLQTAAGPDEESSYRATDLAADGTTLYLVVPGTGIVTHDFVPADICP